MTQQTLNPFRFQTHESVYGTRPRHRRSRLAAQAIAVLLAITIPVLPVSPAFAQVLEVPQVIGAPASPPSSSGYGSTPGTYGSTPGSYGSAPEGSAGDRDAYGSPTDPDSNGSGPAGYAANPNAYNGSAAALESGRQCRSECARRSRQRAAYGRVKLRLCARPQSGIDRRLSESARRQCPIGTGSYFRRRSARRTAAVDDHPAYRWRTYRRPGRPRDGYFPSPPLTITAVPAKASRESRATPRFRRYKSLSLTQLS